MSDLILIGYPDENRAQQVWEELVRPQNDLVVDLEDAAIIRRDEKGKLYVTTPAQSSPETLVRGGRPGRRPAHRGGRFPDA